MGFNVLRFVSGAAKLPRLRYPLLLATALSLGVIVWEHLLYLYFFSDVTWRLAGVATHSLLDLALLFPLALAAAVCGRALARRFGMGERDWSGLFGSAAVVSLLFVLLLVPAVRVHDLGHEAFAARFALTPAVTPAAAGEGGALAEGQPVLCSYGALRGAGGASGAIGSSATGALGLIDYGFRDALMSQVVVLPVILLGLLLTWRRDLSWGLVLNPRRRRRLARRALKFAPVALALALLLILGGPMGSFEGASTASASSGFNACTDGGPQRTYNVSAIHVVMTLNRFGDHNPEAFMYALDERISEIRDFEAALEADRTKSDGPGVTRVSLGLRKDPIQPLVIRANMGECLVINFTNRLNDGPASFHVQGLPYTVESAAGEVGFNPDTFARNGETITYRFPIPDDSTAERAFYVHDHGASRQRVAHGLFGAVVVEPAGSEHLDPETGEPLTINNWEAIIKVPDGVSFREFVIMYHEVGDETFDKIRDKNGNNLPLVDDLAGVYRPAARALNYRSEPFRRRLELEKDKSQGYGSYMFGDPPTPVPRSYLGEPTKTRLMHGGSEVFHVHHLHGGSDRWRRNPKADTGNDISSGLNKRPFQNAFSIHLDSQSIGPGTSYNLEHECGAGGCQQVAGDFLYHCHIGHHYISGMWAFWRVFDTEQPDLAVVPDLFVHGNRVTEPPAAVNSIGLIGVAIEELGGKVLVPRDQLTDPSTQFPLEDWVEDQLPPPGQRIDSQDATVWDWVRVDTADGPLYLGEPEDSAVWANFFSPAPGERPEILFNPKNGKYAWPLLRPHLGKRPPFSPRGHSGAPWLGERGSDVKLDGLCPAPTVWDLPDQNIRHYPITAITLPIQVTRTDEDPEGKIFVLNEDKAAVRNGTKPAQPLVIRSNVGDCVNIILTSELDPEKDDRVNMHTHFVQFDPQASDGVITGFSYEQSVKPYLTEDRFLTEAAAAGDDTIVVNHTDRLHAETAGSLGIWLGIGLGEGIQPDPDGGDQPVPHTEIRRIVAINGNAITLDRPLRFSHAAGEAVGVEFVQYNWYSDVDFGTVFWHDHVEFKNWDHGLFGAHVVEPTFSTYHDPVTGDEVRSGTIVDVLSNKPSGSDIPPVAFGHDGGSFREFFVFLHSNNPATGGPDGGGTINLRSEPFDLRGGDPAFLFSSVTHGDPFTPLFRAYVGDPIVIRGMGLVERVGGLRVTGHRFRVERFADVGDLSDTTFIGISERFDFLLEGNAGGPLGKAGDYLYYSTVGRHFKSGAWGLLRVHDTLQSNLRPLPDRPAPPSGSGFPEQTVTGGDPQAATDPGQLCPSDAPVRKYEVKITEAEIVFHDKLRDSNGFVYMLGSGGGSSGSKPKVTEPLVLRVNQGECLEVKLSNTLGERASLHVGELLFDPQGSYGAAIGFNLDSTVAKGKSRTYRFYADQELGTTLLLNLGNVFRLPRGAFGAVVVEPAGSEYRDPATGKTIQTGVRAEIVTPNGSFRELVALFQDEDERIGQNVMPYPKEVQGFTGISYSAEPLKERDFDKDAHAVFDSDVHGDPRLLITAPAGQPFLFRVAAPWAEQVHVFSVEGHRFPLEPRMTNSERLFSRLLAPGMSFDAPLVGGAGSEIGAPGDYLFLDQRDPFTEAGLWGILRVTSP